MWVWSLEPGVPQKGASLSPALFVGQQWTSSFLEETGLLWGWTGSSAYRPHSSSSALAVAPVCIMKAASNSQPPPRWTLFWGTLGQRAHEKCHVSGPKVTNLTTETHLRVLSHSPLPPTTFYPPSPAPVYLHRWDPAGRCIGSTHRTRCSRPRVQSCDPLRFPASPWGPSLPVRRWSSRQAVWTLSSGPSTALPRGDLPSRYRLRLFRRPSSRDSVPTRETAYSRTRPPPGSQDWRVEVTDAAGQPSPPPRPCWLWRPAFWPPAAARCPPELRRASPGVCGREPPGMQSHPGPDSVSGRTSDWSASRSRFAPRRTAWKQRVWRRLNDTSDDTGSCVTAERVLSVGEQVEVVMRSGSSGTMQRNDDFKK